MATDVTTTTFEQAVIDAFPRGARRGRLLGRLVRPLPGLTPALERAAEQRSGKVELVKVDVDANQDLPRGIGVQGIPAVKAFKDGEVVDEFVGAIPQAAVERFFDQLVPSEADALAAEGDEQSLRRALELDPRHAGAAAALGADPARARRCRRARSRCSRTSAGDFVAEGLAARAKLIASGPRTTCPTSARVSTRSPSGDPELGPRATRVGARDRAGRRHAT